MACVSCFTFQLPEGAVLVDGAGKVLPLTAALGGLGFDPGGSYSGACSVSRLAPAALISVYQH